MRIFVLFSAVLAVAAPALVAGCVEPAEPAEPGTDQWPRVDSPAQLARDQLAARAAAAVDRRLTASYLWSAEDRPDRTVTVVEATDGSWRVDVPGAALDGAADVTMIGTAAGLFQCLLPPAAEPAACARLADRDAPPLENSVPQIWHVFTDWPAVLTDRRAPLDIAAEPPLPAIGGDCYSVGSTSASLAAPLAVGVYCYQPDGTFTGARLSLGKLRLVGPPAPAPATVELPGAVVAGGPQPVGTPAAVAEEESALAPLAALPAGGRGGDADRGLGSPGAEDRLGERKIRHDPCLIVRANLPRLDTIT